MINLIRSINYSMRRNLVMWITVITMLCLPVITVGMAMGEPLTEMDGAKYYCMVIGELFFIVIFALMIFSCIPASADAGDRTINYEVMAGHSRSSIFFARLTAGLTWGVVITAFLYYIPLVYFGCIGGWYKGVSVSDVALRVVLSLFPLFRISAFFIMLSFLFRSAGKGIGFGFLLHEAGTIIYEVITETFNLGDHFCPWFMGMLNVVELHTITNVRDYVIAEEKVSVYDTALGSDMVVMTICVSFLIGSIYIAAAYIDFLKRDRA